ncbi:co-chaperone HscB [Pseudaeromonas paramecii]|uniref:co-chaperone HscB n=1 Tax=Pseudaeromonas paramecii TaxID=2138166 RepID=UPI0031EA6B97
MNYFEIFHLPIAFELDSVELASRYRQLQQQYHPDKFAAASEADRSRALQWAAEINAAFNTLKEPVARAEYLLSLQGLEIRGEQQTLQDLDFLEQQWAWREALEALPAATAPLLASANLAEELSLTQRQMQTALSQTLAAGEWPAAADWVRKLKFMAKLQLELERLEDSLLDD